VVEATAWFASFFSVSLQQQDEDSVVALPFAFSVSADWLLLLQFPCFRPAAPC